MEQIDLGATCNEEHVVCPACRGTGSLPVPRAKKKEAFTKKTAALALVNAGFSYREVCKLLGLKSAASISKYLGLS
jgi:hypothetical protein